MSRAVASDGDVVGHQHAVEQRRRGDVLVSHAPPSAAIVGVVETGALDYVIAAVEARLAVGVGNVTLADEPCDGQAVEDVTGGDFAPLVGDAGERRLVARELQESWLFASPETIFGPDVVSASSSRGCKANLNSRSGFARQSPDAEA